jgi:hypothetical protein
VHYRGLSRVLTSSVAHFGGLGNRTNKEIIMPAAKKAKARRGAKGERGIPGPPGRSGDVGPRGATGSQGVEGRRGTIGLTGHDGAMGPSGLNASLGDVAKQVRYIDRSIENIYNEMGTHITRMTQLQKELDLLRETVRKLVAKSSTGLRSS